MTFGEYKLWELAGLALAGVAAWFFVVKARPPR